MVTFPSSPTEISSQKLDLIRVLLVDDQNIVRCKLQEILAVEKNIEIVGTAKDGKEAIALVETLKPDVILMDIEMPRMNGIQATQIITEKFSQAKILILTTHEKDEYVREIFSAGANGYILKHSSSLDLVTAIRSVHNGHSHFSLGTIKKIQLSFPPTKSLSPPAKSKEIDNSVDKPDSSAVSIFQKLFKSQKKILIPIVSTVAITSATVIYAIFQTKAINSKPQPSESIPVVPASAINNRRISALGRVQPITEVIKVSVSASLSSDRVAELLVKRGDLVKAGQVIAILDSHLRLENALAQAQAQAKVAQAKLAQVQAGAASGEINAQKIEIFRLQKNLNDEIKIQKAIVARQQVEVEDAKSNYDRYLSLYRQKAISASELDSRKLTLATAQKQAEEAQARQNKNAAQLEEEIKQSQANLDKIAKVRPTDVAVAQSEVDQEIVAVKKAKDDLAEAYIRAPTAGRIFDIKAKPGEVVGTDGIVEMGKTSQMEVVAEIYESDIDKIREGQPAQIVSDSFSEKLQGTVRQISLQVTQQKVTNGEPGENLDRKVIEVRIKLNPKSSQKVSSLTNLQVQVLI